MHKEDKTGIKHLSILPFYNYLDNLHYDFYVRSVMALIEMKFHTDDALD